MSKNNEANYYKDLVEHFEYRTGGYAKLCGVDLRAINVKIGKEKILADIIITDCEEGNQQRYNKCEYPKEALLKLK